MAFQIDKRFVVKAAPAAVWEFLTDPRRVARCLPGASITEQVDAHTYSGAITVKVGPVSASYKGKLRFENLDAASRSAQIVASGQELRGKGGASMRLTSRLAERGPGETEVAATSELNVTGVLAQLGRGMIQDVGDQMFARFSEAMRAELEAPPAAAAPAAGAAPPAPAPAAVDVVSLGADAGLRALARAVRQPVFWMAAAALALVAWRLWPRRSRQLPAAWRVPR